MDAFGYGPEKKKKKYIYMLFDILIFKIKLTRDVTYVIAGPMTFFDHFWKMKTFIFLTIYNPEDACVHIRLEEVHLW